MKKTSFFVVCLIFLYLGLVVYISTVDTTTPGVQLVDLLRDRWTAYGDTRVGWDRTVLSVYFESPTKGRSFVTTGRTNNENTHFRGASTTKMFTAASIMLLKQNGLLRLDDTIDMYLPNTSNFAIPYKESITLRNLLENRGGVWDLPNQPLRDNTSYIDDLRALDPTHQFTTEELIGVIARGNYTNGPPDKEFYYSNSGYRLLADIVERVSGVSYATFVTTHFLIPNGLDDTTFPSRGDDLRLPEPSMDGHSWLNDTVMTVREFNLSPSVGEGNIVTTVADLSRWLARLFTGRTVITNASRDEMMNVKETGTGGFYGLGIIFSPLIGHGHTGQVGGFYTYAFYDVSLDAVLILSASVTPPNDLQLSLEYSTFLAKLYIEVKGFFTS